MSVSFAYPAGRIDAAQLHDELLAADVPVERVESGDAVTDPGTEDEVRMPTVWVVVPSGTTQDDVDTVVAAHVPRVRYDPATRLAEVTALRQEAGRAALLARTRTATTVADLKAVLLAHLQEEAAG